MLRRCIPCDSSNIVFTVEVASGGHVADNVVGELQIIGETNMHESGFSKVYFFGNHHFLIFSDLLRIHEVSFVFFTTPKNSAETDGRSLRL